MVSDFSSGWIHLHWDSFYASYSHKQHLLVRRLVSRICRVEKCDWRVPVCAVSVNSYREQNQTISLHILLYNKQKCVLTMSLILSKSNESLSVSRCGRGSSSK